ncbi:amino acid permease [Crocosphaera chwakensis]|uniref:Na-K-Cl cotransporter, putative n=1 Tax=Crocosphaera chwakensis CCY0110 TaxID=391612 RepID=A3IKP0_9CHRO|nr:amino acid permease [Crocosphaera chwakensis]EAZ92759.1 Na-K-Cl cotransporter, putative [Crocosphaera chwakensis CCY0110]
MSFKIKKILKFLNPSQFNTSTSPPKKYNTFEGVFKPTLLTILGAIMYLRIGWVVGNAGLWGGLTVVLLSVSITVATGLSIASIATNTRMGDGGPYAMISKSLGLEIGGSVGVPLFVSQALAAAMYIFGFREGWLFLFPEHPPLLIDFTVFLVIFIIAYISASFAFRVQYLVLILIILSLFSIFSSSLTWESNQTWQDWGDFSNISFWGVFAVFFPATTGIMSGVNMSGELENSRQNIPIGTLSAIALSTIIYVILCWWVARAAPPQELINNYTILVEKSRWQFLVLMGLLAATFSASLSSLVGAPRILTALAKDGVIPWGNGLAKLSKNGEPRRALLVSAGIVLLALLLRDLNAIAPLITLFFLLTYATINLVVLVESSLGLMNFRPTFKVPIIVPLYGILGCILAMLVIRPFLSLVAIAIVLAIYLRLVSLPKEKRPADVRSGIFTAIAQWSAMKVIQLDLTNVRAWKPTFLVPIEDGSQLLGEFRLLLDLSQPEGFLQLLGIVTNNQGETLSLQLRELASSFRHHKLLTTISVMKVELESEGMIAALQALQSAFFRPNILFLRFPDQASDWDQLLPVFNEAKLLDVGVMLLGLHPSAGLGRMEVINLWIRPQLEDLPMIERLEKGNIDLAILMALRLSKAWKAQLNIISVIPKEEDRKEADNYIKSLRDLCRIPATANNLIIVGEFPNCISQTPQGDMDFIGLQSTPDFHFVNQIITMTGSSCLFMSDSGSESALA